MCGSDFLSGKHSKGKQAAARRHNRMVASVRFRRGEYDMISRINRGLKTRRLKEPTVVVDDHDLQYDYQYSPRYYKPKD